MNPASVTRLEKTLSIIAAVLAVLIFIGTIFGIAKKSADASAPQTGKRTSMYGREAAPYEEIVSSGKAEKLNKISDDETAAYFSLGQIRVVTAADAKKRNDSGTVLVVSPWLSYVAEDNTFFEELSRKRGVIKGIFSSYFSNHTKKELQKKNEEKVCQELMSQINAQLSLGKISAINLTDYMFFE